MNKSSAKVAASDFTVYTLLRNNENSEKNKSKLHTETQQSSSAVNAKSMRPLTECSSAGCFDSIPGPGKSLILRENQTASSLNSQPSTSGLEDCLKMVGYPFSFTVVV